MVPARRIAKRRHVEIFLLAIGVGAALAGACRRKPEATAPVAEVTPSGPVSDGILEGLQRELATAKTINSDTAERVKPVQPTLKCVETVSGTEMRAHFGYSNSAHEEVKIPVGIFNRFWPPPLGRAQPTVFAPGSRNDVLKVTFNPLGSTAWVLGSAFVLADAHAPSCATTIGK